jgi:sulfite reductase alpha subunit-like flavoprotein
MIEVAGLLWEMIDKKSAHVYVCGDGKNMSKDVYRAFVRIIKSNSKDMMDAQAEAYLSNMRAASRYLEDVWT